MKKTIAVIALIAAPALASAQAGLCGVTNVDGHYGPQTRRAIATCAKKFNSANNAAALLAAMNIGFGPSDTPPVKAGGMSGDNSVGTATEAKAEGESMKTEAKEGKKSVHHAKKKAVAK